MVKGWKQQGFILFQIANKNIQKLIEIKIKFYCNIQIKKAANLNPFPNSALRVSDFYSIETEFPMLFWRCCVRLDLIVQSIHTLVGTAAFYGRLLRRAACRETGNKMHTHSLSPAFHPRNAPQIASFGLKVNFPRRILQSCTQACAAIW